VICDLTGEERGLPCNVEIHVPEGEAVRHTKSLWRARPGGLFLKKLTTSKNLGLGKRVLRVDENAHPYYKLG